ncbi:CGNR zinc finger domain-containing protein [Stappia sp.]|jgi:predicted RNA-binding Zn ribbon-like protein|uniref:CGNR zinc finger domain-containing protein n=1 Tax=Stappia sp. TaxID=1870903 RepID=UPI003D0D64DF
MNDRQPFEFIAGSPALCLVDTMGNRGGDRDGGAVIERLPDPAALDAWLCAAGLSSQAGDAANRKDLDEARTLREAIHRCGLAAIAGEDLPAADLALVNRAASAKPLRPQLVAGRIVHLAAAPVQGALSLLAADALALFVDPLRDRLRQCPECRMMFLDTSRPGKRLWCSSAQGCGNRAKVRKYRARQAAAQNGGNGT